MTTIKVVVRNVEESLKHDLGEFSLEELLALVKAFRAIPDVWFNSECNVSHIQWIFDDVDLDDCHIEIVLS